MEVTVHLWGVLGDRSMWEPLCRLPDWRYPAHHYLTSSCDALLSMLDRVQGMVHSSIGSFSSISRAAVVSGDGSTDGVGLVSTGPFLEKMAWGCAVHQALDLISLIPHVDWGHLKTPGVMAAALRHSSSELKTKVLTILGSLELRTSNFTNDSTMDVLCCTVVSARAGWVTEGYKQRIVALLGGVNSSSSTPVACDTSASSCLPSPMPAILTELMDAEALTLADLFIALLRLYWERLFCENRPLVSAFTAQLVHLFGSAQLPHLSALLVPSDPRQQDSQPMVAAYKLPMTPAFSRLWMPGPFRDAYLTWVQASCLSVLDHALNTQDVT
jgi:hypothetical protein